MEDREQVLRVLVDLGALALREDVLDVERMPAEALRELRGLLRGGGVEMCPGQAVGAELGEPRLTRADGLCRGALPLPLDAGQARHGD